MPSHLVAFYVEDYGKTDQEMPLVEDQVLTKTAAGRILLPAEYHFVHWAYAAGVNLQDAYIYTPSLETRRWLARIIPGNYGALGMDLAKSPVFSPARPIELLEEEEMMVKYTTGGTAAAASAVLVCLGPATLPDMPAGDIRIMKCTASTTLTKGVWTPISYTPEKTFEKGEYALVGLIPISANAIAARVRFEGQVWRPGVPAIAGSEPAAKVFTKDYLLYTQFYEMGRFTHLRLPQIEFLAAAADTSETVYLIYVKTA
jgi:hypothetical protein